MAKKKFGVRCTLRVICATRLFQELVEERLIRERTGHRSNALFKYEKSSVEQQHQVSKILGPPENRETTGKRSNAEVSENELESLLSTDLEFEVSDDVLSNMPLPDYCTDGIENFSRCVVHNCTIKTDSAQSSSNKCKNYLLKIYTQHIIFLNTI